MTHGTRMRGPISCAVDACALKAMHSYNHAAVAKCIA
jgi:hypothetical protein